MLNATMSGYIHNSFGFDLHLGKEYFYCLGNTSGAQFRYVRNKNSKIKTNINQRLHIFFHSI